jgi:ribonuclease HI
MIYCDGACSGNPGPAGSAAILIDDPGLRVETVLSRPHGFATNQIAELDAFLLALDLAGALRAPTIIRTDSQYVVKGAGEWLPNWKRNGWRNAQRKPVANEAVWKAIDAKVLALDPKPAVAWIKGHAGDRWNEVVDRIAEEASRPRPDFAVCSPPRLAGHPPMIAGDPSLLPERRRYHAIYADPPRAF